MRWGRGQLQPDPACLLPGCPLLGAVPSWGALPSLLLSFSAFGKQECPHPSLPQFPRYLTAAPLSARAPPSVAGAGGWGVGVQAGSELQNHGSEAGLAEEPPVPSVQDDQGPGWLGCSVCSPAQARRGCLAEQFQVGDRDLALLVASFTDEPVRVHARQTVDRDELWRAERPAQALATAESDWGVCTPGQSLLSLNPPPPPLLPQHLGQRHLVLILSKPSLPHCPRPTSSARRASSLLSAAS